MNGKNVALLLIGFQNDYFSKDGILNGAFEDANAIDPLLKNTQSLIRTVIDAGGMVVETPINFNADYSELDEPIGILKVIKDNKAFIRDEYGSQSVPMVKEFEGELGSLPGKRGMSCFSNT
jgi:nicotinamidase-related amidase